MGHIQLVAEGNSSKMFLLSFPLCNGKIIGMGWRSKAKHRGTVLSHKPTYIIRNTPIIWKSNFLSQFPCGSKWMAEEIECFPAWPKPSLNYSFGYKPYCAQEKILQLPPESGGYLLHFLEQLLGSLCLQDRPDLSMKVVCSMYRARILKAFLLSFYLLSVLHFL